MPRGDRSVTILTAMIVAALYVILIVGANQETGLRRAGSPDAPRGQVLNEFFQTPLRGMLDRKGRRP